MFNQYPPPPNPNTTPPAKTVHVIGLDREGFNLCNLLEGLGINNQHPRISQAMTSLTDLQFVYNELISQILLGLSENQNEFLEHLKSVPDFRYLEHIDLMRDPVMCQTIRHEAQKFGLELFFRISQTIPLSSASSYLIEHATRSLVVITECPKGDVLNA